jgi:UPF0716 family protein affecting phage T7 exclusion
VSIDFLFYFTSFFFLQFFFSILFFTDVIGFSLLVPFCRDLLRHALARHFETAIHSEQTYYRQEQADIIDAEYERVDEKDKP